MTAPERDALCYPGFCDVIDVSSCQTAAIDWVRVRAAGFVAAIIKAADGAKGVDPDALENLERARAAGLFTLVYLFARISDDPDAEADNLWRASGPTMPHRAVVDLESAPAGWTPEQIARGGIKLADAIEQRFGQPPDLYTYRDFYDHRVLPAILADAELADAYARLPLWIAHYMSTTTPWVPPPGFQPYTPKPWSRWTLHQYSGNGGFRVPGVPGDCDRSLFNGDLDALRKHLGLPPATPSDPTIPSVYAPVDFQPRPIEVDDDEPPAT